MATQKGTLITNIDATPITVVDGRKMGGILRYYGDSFELTDTANGDNAIVLKVPVDALLVDLFFASDDLGTAGTVDIGFFRKETGGTYTAIDADAIANNIDVNSGAVSRTSYRYSVKGIETQGQALWELAGLSSRPTTYDDIYIGLTTDTGTTADGTVVLEAYCSIS